MEKSTSLTGSASPYFGEQKPVQSTGIWEWISKIAMGIFKGLSLIFANIATQCKTVLFGTAPTQDVPPVISESTKKLPYFFFGDTNALKSFANDQYKLVEQISNDLKESVIQGTCRVVQVFRTDLRIGNTEVNKISLCERAFSRKALYLFLDFGSTSMLDPSKPLSTLISDMDSTISITNRVHLVRTQNGSEEKIDDPETLFAELDKLG